MFIGQHARTFTRANIIGYGVADGLPRNEISCHESFLRLTQADITAAQPRLNADGSPTQHFRQLLLEQVLQHEALYKAYPGLRHTKVTLTCPLPSAQATRRIEGGYCEGAITLNLWPDSDLAEVHRTVAHEVQHNIQDIEGFSPGMTNSGRMTTAHQRLTRALEKRFARTGHPLLTSKLRDLDYASRPDPMSYYFTSTFLRPGDIERFEAAGKQLEKHGNRAYARDPGENEARATETRLHLTPAQRAATPALHLAATRPAVISETHDNRAAHDLHHKRALMALLVPSAVFNAASRLLKRLPLKKPAHTP